MLNGPAQTRPSVNHSPLAQQLHKEIQKPKPFTRHVLEPDSSQAFVDGDRSLSW